MRKDKDRLEKTLFKWMQLFAVPSNRHVDDSRERLHQRLLLEDMRPSDSTLTRSLLHAKRRDTMQRWGLLAAAVLLLGVVSSANLIYEWMSFARVESEQGSVYRVNEGALQGLGRGTRIGQGQIIRSGEMTGGGLVLSDGSQVEMRAQSELVLERADDGVRIRLNKGSVIVNAAKQHGHLYVQTKDVTVSVVGTVFVVQAEEEGSRVAVIEGL